VLSFDINDLLIPTLSPFPVTFKLFPNPVRDTLWLQFLEHHTESLRVTVFDTNGSSRSSYEFNTGDGRASIPVDDLQPGVYFLQTQNGAEDCMKPFIVSR